jgi:serine/threonine protein kinase
LFQQLGRGNFGEVSLGFLSKADGSNGELVAVKRPHTSEGDQNRLAIQRSMICDEMKIMLFIGDHENVLRLVATVSANPSTYLITEYCEHGSVLDYLKNTREKNLFFDELAVQQVFA